MFKQTSLGMTCFVSQLLTFISAIIKNSKKGETNFNKEKSKHLFDTNGKNYEMSAIDYYVEHQIDIIIFIAVFLRYLEEGSVSDLPCSRAVYAWCKSDAVQRHWNRHITPA